MDCIDSKIFIHMQSLKSNENYSIQGTYKTFTYKY